MKQPLSEPAIAGEHRIEIFHSGSCDLFIRKSCELAAKAAESLGEGVAVLYLNVLTSEARLEHEMRKVCRSHGGAATRKKLLVMTVKPDDLLTHTSFIERTIATHGVCLVVLNAFDFAAMMPRRRMRLVAFLQQLRDFSAVDVAVGTRREPSEFDAGSYGALAFLSASVTALRELDAFFLSAARDIADETEVSAAIMLRPYIVQSGSLKTNDLSILSDTPPFRRYAAAA